MSSRPWLLALVLSCGCHMILPLTTKEDATTPTDSTPGVENRPSLEGQPRHDGPVKTDAPTGPCHLGNLGACHPDITGEVCTATGWKTPTCADKCGEPHAAANPGYCDPRWSVCVGPGFINCDEYCKSENMRCCDSMKHKLDQSDPEYCAQHERCITARGFHYTSTTGSDWGAESWSNNADCVARFDPKEGVGQHYCDGTNAIPKVWNETIKRFRCCCYP